MSTTEMYAARVGARHRICVGLDPDKTKVPDCVKGNTEASRTVRFMTDIVEGTAGVAAAFKPQIAFFEALGSKGHRSLRDVVRHVRDVDSTIPVLLDYKRGDIGNTNAGYVDLAYDYLGVDGVTLHPYLGMEAMKPFLVQKGKLSIVLCRTSNSGAGELQDVPARPSLKEETGMLYANAKQAKTEGVRGPFKRVSMPYYQFVAARVAQSWNAIGECAVVVGATWASELQLVRRIVGDKLILVPGLGSQGGKVEDVIPGALNDIGWGVILNNASAINFAFDRIKNPDGSKKYRPEQYAMAASEAAVSMNEAVAQRLFDLAA